MDRRRLEEKKRIAAAGFVGESSSFPPHPDHPCCKLHGCFPVLLLKLVVIYLEEHFYRVLSQFLAFTRRELLQRSNTFVSRVASLMVLLSPTAAAGRVCLPHLCFGPWGVLGIIAFISNFPCFDLS